MASTQLNSSSILNSFKGWSQNSDRDQQKEELALGDSYGNAPIKVKFNIAEPGRSTYSEMVNEFQPSGKNDHGEINLES